EVAGVVAQAVPLDVAVLAAAATIDVDGEHLGGRIPAERDRGTGGDGGGDVGSVQCATGAVVLGPAFVDGDLGFVVARGDRGGLELVGAVAVGVLQPRAEAIGLPVTGAAELALEAACGGGDDRGDVVGDPVGGVVVIELHAGRVSQV